jgi:hypothetical protein
MATVSATVLSTVVVTTEHLVRLVKEICESFKLWSELDELERLMQCDNIFGTLALMRTRMAQFGIDCQEEVFNSEKHICIVSEHHSYSPPSPILGLGSSMTSCLPSFLFLRRQMGLIAWNVFLLIRFIKQWPSFNVFWTQSRLLVLVI